jgi:hypothetical protein
MQSPNLGAYREGDGDLVVERRLEIHLTGGAMIVAMDRLEFAKALDHARAFRAQEQPVHAEKSKRRGMEKEIDDLIFAQASVAREGEWIDAEQRLVVGRANMGLEPGEQTGSMIAPSRAWRGGHPAALRSRLQTWAISPAAQQNTITGLEGARVREATINPG